MVFLLSLFTANQLLSFDPEQLGNINEIGSVGVGNESQEFWNGRITYKDAVRYPSRDVGN